MNSKALLYRLLTGLTPVCSLIAADFSAIPIRGAATQVEQLSIATVDAMPRIPEPLVVRDWPMVSRDYYKLVANPDTVLDGERFVEYVSSESGFRMPTYLGGPMHDEALVTLTSVIGMQLVGLDASAHNGVDWLEASQAWFDDKHGLFRHHRGVKDPVLHSGIYGFDSALYGIMFAAQHPDNDDLQKQLRSTVSAFETIARGLGCPDNPNFDVLGYDFSTERAGGRNEPMNRLGNAPSVAWPLVVGAHLYPEDREDYVAYAESALRWHIDNPGRYELTYMMGPLAAARLNAEHATDIDLEALMRIWFGNGTLQQMPWHVTSGVEYDGLTVDGLDGAKLNEADGSFYAFTVSTLRGPAWLIPLVRYEPAYARSIAKYALHAANSARLLQGEGLTWEQQDHLDWKQRWDPKNLLFYEGIMSYDWSGGRLFQPYATGDPIRSGWNTEKVEAADYLQEKKEWFSKSSNNLSLYSGNSIGFLGGICELTNVPGILRWDCLKTDWFHAAAYPTHMLYNPHLREERVTLHLEASAHLYDLVSKRVVARNVKSGDHLILAQDQVVVLVEVPVGSRGQEVGGRLLVDDVIVDFNP